jgi:hypothetical protein
MMNVELNHRIVHLVRLGKADRPELQPLYPRPEVEVLLLDPQRPASALSMMLARQQPVIRRPAVGRVSKSRLMSENYSFWTLVV